MVAMLFVGCSSYEPVIMPFGKTYGYTVEMTDASDKCISDLCRVRMTTSKKKYHGQFGLNYEYDSCMGYPMYTEHTGYIEDKDHIELHPPRMGMLAFTEVLPFPIYHLPVGCVATANGSLTVARSTFSKASGKTIEYRYEQSGEDTIFMEGEQLLCYTVVGENTNHHDDIGHYQVKYWFNPEYGFVRWIYTLPDGNKVWLILDEIR